MRERERGVLGTKKRPKNQPLRWKYERREKLKEGGKRLRSVQFNVINMRVKNHEKFKSLNHFSRLYICLHKDGQFIPLFQSSINVSK